MDALKRRRPLFCGRRQRTVRPRQVDSESFRQIYPLVHRHKSRRALPALVSWLFSRSAILSASPHDADHDLLLDSTGWPVKTSKTGQLSGWFMRGIAVCHIPHAFSLFARYRRCRSVQVRRMPSFRNRPP